MEGRGVWCHTSGSPDKKPTRTTVGSGAALRQWPGLLVCWRQSKQTRNKAESCLSDLHTHRQTRTHTRTKRKEKKRIDSLICVWAYPRRAAVRGDISNVYIKAEKNSAPAWMTATPISLFTYVNSPRKELQNKAKKQRRVSKKKKEASSSKCGESRSKSHLVKAFRFPTSKNVLHLLPC